MKIEFELNKGNKLYKISGKTFVCYGRNIKEVFDNLKKVFIKLEELNQLNL